MRKSIFSIILGGFILLCSPTYSGDIKALMDSADRLFFSYHEDLSRLEQSIKIYEEVLKIDPGNVRAQVMISRLWLTYGDLVPESEDGKKQAYIKGRDWAERALKMDENSAQAHFWFFANEGRLQQLKGILHGLKSLPKLKKHITRAYELDPNDVMIVDGIGTFYCEVPGLMGGDLKKSEELLRKAIELDPNYTLAYYDLAWTLYRQKRFKDALEMAKKVLSIEKPTYYADWVTWDKPKAEKLISEIEGR